MAGTDSSRKGKKQVSFEEHLHSFIQQYRLFDKNDRLLLAVSGGVDSMVMWQALWRLDYGPLAIAHCNFQLRATDSIADERFVKALALEGGNPFHKVAFETKKVAKEEGISTQLAARKLRYEWFARLMKDHGYQYLLTAHHFDDRIETALLNFARGSGVKGLGGIPLKRGRIRRPLLWAEKAEIVEYAEENGIKWREDVSNETLDYDRNYLRHELIPRLEKILPGYRKGMLASMENAGEAWKIVSQAAGDVLEKELRKERQGTQLDRNTVNNFSSPSTLLHYWLHPYGFDRSQILDMVKAGSGAVFHSGGHDLYVDRDRFILRESHSPGKKMAVVPEVPDQLEIQSDWGTFEFSTEDRSAFQQDPNVAQFDLERIAWPLRLRSWRKGDWFCPFGMEGQRKKLKDLFTDMKLSVPEKMEQPVMEDASGKICWLPGLRLDERCKVRDETARVLYVRYRPK